MLKRVAIKECKKLWKEIGESGLSKAEFLRTERGKFWRDKGYNSNCPLCQYVNEKNNIKPVDARCMTYCPLYHKYKKGCFVLGYLKLFPDPDFAKAVAGL